jgi:GDSL-like Lipase/Acylhydrolase family
MITRNQGPIRFLGRLLLFALLLGGLELAMRATGYFLQRPATLANALQPEDEGKFRILALGESTTADYFADGKNISWPRQLQEMLVERGIATRVYNEGLAGTQSVFILARLPEYLRQYRPHLVITMMGVNDAPGLAYGTSFPRRIEMEIHQLRLFKLVHWSLAAAGSLFPTCHLTDLKFENFPDQVEQGLELARQLSVPEVESRLKAAVHNQSELAVIMAGIAVRLRGDFSNPAANSRALEYSERAFSLDPRDQNTIFWSLNGHPSPSHCENVIRSLTPCRDELPDQLLASISLCFLAYPELREAKILWAHGIEVDRENPPATGDHYRSLHRILRENGVLHIAMQYPTRPLSELSDYFRTEPEEVRKDIAFVSNETNFLEALEKHPYGEIFTDRFGKTWGHTTPLGHRLIAANLAPVVEQMVRGKNLKAKKWK